MSKLITLLKKIKQSVKKGEYKEAEKKIPRFALILVNDIESGKLTGEEINQVSDQFFNLFEIQLEKKIFSFEIEELLQRCFSLHAVLPVDSKEFKTELESIKKLAKIILFKMEKNNK